MLLTWYLLVAIMITGYVVFDGFDLGAGILHLFIARTDEERQTMIRTIGPVWDGNEVWLLAGGGTLYFAFPLLYASGFSGFYLPLMIVLWLLIFRALGVELRLHLDTPVWTGLFDRAFGLASLLLSVFYGAALGNVLRGVPLGHDEYFFLPLWTNWRVGPEPGILDWYTVLAGVVALVALALHGAYYVALKTSGEINARAKRAAKALWPFLVALTALSLVATLYIRPDLLNNYKRLPVLYVIPVAVAASLFNMWRAGARGQERAAFLSSCAYLIFMLVGAAAGVYPNLLTSTTDPALNITVYNAHTGSYAMSVGLIWWSLGMVIAVGYFVFVYRMFRGKVSATMRHGYGAHARVRRDLER
jgi:cytochrome bd ubiquinol oxidase subunit II